MVREMQLGRCSLHDLGPVFIAVSLRLKFCLEIDHEKSHCVIVYRRNFNPCRTF